MTFLMCLEENGWICFTQTLNINTMDRCNHTQAGQFKLWSVPKDKKKHNQTEDNNIMDYS